jgi:broad specificity phosphatase PhoE
MAGDARIHFVRHAETLFNVNGQLQGWCDSPLSERGERQAAALGEWMRAKPLAAAFTSDLTRTRTTTAAALAGHPQIVPVPMTELREWHLGGWEGQPNARLWTPVFAQYGYEYATGTAAWSTINADGRESVIDTVQQLDPLRRAESSADVLARLDSGLAVILAAAQKASETGGEVLAVTHGMVLGTILRRLVPGHAAQAGFPNCGTVTVTWSDGRIEIGDVTDSGAVLA